jgi:cell division protein DivIC
VKGILVISVLLLILLVSFIGGRKLQAQINAGNEKMNDLEEQLTDEKDREKEISELRERIQSDEYKEQVAKDKLGLVKDGEIIFKKSGKNNDENGGGDNPMDAQPVEPEQTETEDDGTQDSGIPDENTDNN